MEHTRGIDTNEVEEKGSNEAEHNGSYGAASINSYPLVGGEVAGGGNRPVLCQFKSGVELGAGGPAWSIYRWHNGIHAHEHVYTAHNYIIIVYLLKR